MDFTKKEGLLHNEFDHLLPGVSMLPLRRGNEQAVASCFYSISPKNKDLATSQYFFKGSAKLVHFTSLEKIKSILSTRNIRLYNLDNLADPREFSFAGDLLTFNKENRSDAKKNIFAVSMCKAKILTGPVENEFNMWRLYGNYGDGVCVELDFLSNERKNWKDYFLSEVFYGSSSRVNLIKVKQLLLKYQHQNPQTEIDLAPIVAFHKSNLYKLEGEVRLLFDGRQKKVFSVTTYLDHANNKLSPIVKADTEKSSLLKKEIQYLELPIYAKDFEFLSEQIPIPRIHRIILGHNYKENFDQAKLELESVIKTRLGYPVKVEKSRLMKYYYEN